MFETPGVVAGLHDVAVMGEAVEQRRRHLGVGKDLRPLGECEVGRDDQRRALVEAADEVEQELPAGLGERQVAEFVEHDQIDAGEGVSEPRGVEMEL